MITYQDGLSAYTDGHPPNYYPLINDVTITLVSSNALVIVCTSVV